MTSAFLVGVDLDKPTGLSAKDSIYELLDLAITAKLSVVGTLIQKRDRPHPKHYVGKGKLDEIQEALDEHCVEVLITDDELSPAQQRFLESHFNIKVLDRTRLILDIFATRAQTHEAQLQVELAQLEYMMPRLTRLWTHLSRLGGGGVGTRGPGEKQLEVDKRLVRKRMGQLRGEIKKVKAHRERHRAQRKTLPLLTGAIVGYTNAGKSTLFNRLTSADVLEEDLLFATLDPTTRRVEMNEQSDVLLTDTVGFIQKLPHQLVDAFKATLEEIYDADFLVHVIDRSNPNYLELIKTSNAVMQELQFDEKPVFYVFNKRDALTEDDAKVQNSLVDFSPHCLISALNTDDLDRLKDNLTEFFSQFERSMTLKIPHHRSDIVHKLHQHGRILSKEYGEQIEMKVAINPVIGEKLLNELFEG